MVKNLLRNHATYYPNKLLLDNKYLEIYQKAYLKSNSGRSDFPFYLAYGIMMQIYKKYICSILGGKIMSTEEITYSAVERNGIVTAIWEMKGRKHVRTIDPRSNEGKRLLSSYHSPEQAAELEAETQKSETNN